MYYNIRILGSVVLQYSGMDWLEVYCNTLVCFAKKRAETISQYSSLYCDSRGNALLDCVATHDRDTASQATTRRRGMRGRGVGRARLGVRGAQVSARGTWHAGAGCGRRAGRSTGSWHGRWACSQGVLLANRLCTRCTQPIFDMV